MIKDEFTSALSNYTSDNDLIQSRWNDVQKKYAGKKRHYHNLTHLDNLTTLLFPLKEKFSSWHVVIFSIAYHDIVYNTLKKDNEEKSAAYAISQLTTINIPAEFIQSTTAFILATKLHGEHSDEINLFTDADLCVLGSDAEEYALYSKQIRKEYSWYPDLVYNPGRAKVLQHFLEMNKIFKTATFRDRYEETARRNLQWELDLLR